MKQENPIKFIYATKFNETDFTFSTQKLKVAKECSRYVSLEDGNRIGTSNIYDIYIDDYGYYGQNIEYMLAHGNVVYTIKPIKKTVKDDTKKEAIEALKSEIEGDKIWLADREASVKELKEKIAKNEAKLTKLLKL